MMVKVQHGSDRERYKPVQEHLQLLWLPPHHALACTGVTIFFISCTDHHIFYLLYRYQSSHFSLNLIQFQFQMLVCKSDLIKAINESDTLFADLKFQQ